MVLLAAAFLFALAFMLCHDLVSQIYVALLERFGKNTMEYGILGTCLTGIVVFLGLVFRVRERRGPLLAWGGLCAALMLATNRFFICTNVEWIHFFQYALFAMLLRLAVRDDAIVLMTSLWVGALDEFIQFASNPFYTNYLDFNDMALNLVGAFLGLYLSALLGLRGGDGPGLKRPMSLMNRAVGGGVLLLGLWGLLTKSIIPVYLLEHPESTFQELEGRTRFILSFSVHDEFWVATAQGRTYHIMDLGEWMVLGPLLSLVMLLFLRVMKKRLDLSQA